MVGATTPMSDYGAPPSSGGGSGGGSGSGVSYLQWTEMMVVLIKQGRNVGRYGVIQQKVNQVGTTTTTIIGSAYSIV
jgi:hypothetical protein